MQVHHQPQMVELAQLLFVSPLQKQDQPTSADVRAAVDRTLTACGGDCTVCAATIAQEAGDHPETYAVRMRWALETVEWAYGQRDLAVAC